VGAHPTTKEISHESTCRICPCCRHADRVGPRLGPVCQGRGRHQVPEIWTEQAKFKEHSDKLQAEAVKLAAAAKTGNLDNLKTAFGAAAGTCKACHDNYRAK